MAAKWEDREMATLCDPSDYPRAIIVAGPYRGNGDTTMVYEVAAIVAGKYSATWAQCRKQSTALARARRERKRRGGWEGAPIFTRFPSEDPVFVGD